MDIWKKEGDRKQGNKDDKNRRADRHNLTYTQTDGEELSVAWRGKRTRYSRRRDGQTQTQKGRKKERLMDSI